MRGFIRWAGNVGGSQQRAAEKWQQEQHAAVTRARDQEAIAASAEVLGNQTWEGSLAFTINVPVAIIGETSTVVPAGASNGTFEVKFEGSGLNLQFTTTCTSPESGRLHIFVVKNQYKLILNNLKRELNKQDGGWYEQLVHRLPWLLCGHWSSSSD